ncbi:MAG: ATP-binding protein [Oscillospiraceae bacterium]|nr:ATP-binding protein [Oscillospiraceae bacterium]
MAYDEKILRRATARYDEEKQRRAEEFRARQRLCFAAAPRLEEIDRTLRQTMAKIVTNGLRRGTDPRSAIAALRAENLNLQRERGELLVAMGYPADYLIEQPACKLCNDTGWTEEGRMCRCLKAHYTREQNKELSRMLDLGHQSFDTFRFEYYSHQPFPGKNTSPYLRMEKNYDACRDYANEFSPKSGNLLLSGAPGLGKTFLSASIARVVSERGYSVVYDTAAHIFERMEAQKFSRGDDEDAEDDVTRYLKCDLLILDDLGTEMSGSFVQSALYRIINTRLMENRKTIISSNLNPAELGTRYGAAIQSRLEGEYRILPFFGEDIRKLKKK